MAPGTMPVGCPLCGEQVEVPINIGIVAVIGNEARVSVQVDTALLGAHVRTAHGGEN